MIPWILDSLVIFTAIRVAKEVESPHMDAASLSKSLEVATGVVKPSDEINWISSSETLLSDLFTLILAREYSDAQTLLEGARTSLDDRYRAYVLFASGCLKALRSRLSLRSNDLVETLTLLEKAAMLMSKLGEHEFLLETLLCRSRLVCCKPFEEEKRIEVSEELLKVQELAQNGLSKVPLLRARLIQCKGHIAFASKRFSDAELLFASAIQEVESIGGMVGWYKTELFLDHANSLKELRNFDSAEHSIQRGLEIEVTGSGDFLRIAKLFHALGLIRYLVDGAEKANRVLFESLAFYDKFPEDFVFEKLDLLNHASQWYSMPAEMKKRIETQRRILISHSRKKQ